MEAFHYRYHPLAHRMRSIVDSGELGTVRRIETSLCFPLPKFSDIRYQYDLAGGATMDVGTYTVHMPRLLGRRARGRVGDARSCAHPTSTGRCAPSSGSRAAHTGHIKRSMWSKWVLQTCRRRSSATAARCT